MNFLLLGSGQSALNIKKYDTEEWTVGAIHNAWSIIPKQTQYFFASGDFIPAEGNRPTDEFKTRARTVTYDEYDGEEQRRLFGRQKYGIGATMLFNAAYWVLGQLQPKTIGFLGCSMDFPNDKPNTFYKAGKADPLRFGRKKLHKWFLFFWMFADQYDAKLYNFGEPGIMPYTRANLKDHFREKQK